MRNVLYRKYQCFSHPLIVVAVLILAYIVGIPAEAEVDAVDPLTGISEELLAKERRVREMHEANREEWEQMLEDERKRGEELLKREEEERQRQLQLEIPDTSHVDPLLKKAWTAYRDYENRNRQQVEQMFMEYLEHNPESPFAPEVYYTIGTMYSTNANRHIGETFDREKRDHYFRKAVEGYGEKLSIHADAARSWLVSSSDIPLADRLDYYEWLIRLDGELESTDVHPAQWIGRHVHYGDSAVMTQQQIEMQIPGLKRYLSGAIPTIERLILRRIRNPAELKVIAERFPDRQLGVVSK